MQDIKENRIPTTPVANAGRPQILVFSQNHCTSASVEFMPLSPEITFNGYTQGKNTWKSILELVNQRT
jgi:hypothetical protein